ncbi:hypothetical protein L1987_25187 [Smallanthus sonchifolius]|uniref:Uncharacterized protein n=1 Tax=Smallanthus sonchifolius TaxID=185202 RepID=A0ACB9IQ67_9ASTR|nr:hypothetical protein L1987_25187 [Smallanthus sonchifolius]
MLVRMMMRRFFLPFFIDASGINSTGENLRPAAKMQIEHEPKKIGVLGLGFVPILDISEMDLSKNDWMLSGQGLESEAGHGDLNGVLMAVFGEEDMSEKAMMLQLLIDLALTASGPEVNALLVWSFVLMSPPSASHCPPLTTPTTVPLVQGEINPDPLCPVHRISSLFPQEHVLQDQLESPDEVPDQSVLDSDDFCRNFDGGTICKDVWGWDDSDELQRILMEERSAKKERVAFGVGVTICKGVWGWEDDQSGGGQRSQVGPVQYIISITFPINLPEVFPVEPSCFVSSFYTNPLNPNHLLHLILQNQTKKCLPLTLLTHTFYYFASLHLCFLPLEPLLTSLSLTNTPIQKLWFKRYKGG